jgi:hypothetical protein
MRLPGRLAGVTALMTSDAVPKNEDRQRGSGGPKSVASRYSGQRGSKGCDYSRLGATALTALNRVTTALTRLRKGTALPRRCPIRGNALARLPGRVLWSPS